MSTKGIYSAVSGAIAQSQQLDTIANNLANVNTTGFKKDKQVFQEYLTGYEKEPSAITVPRVTASIESFYDNGGGDLAYVDAKGTFTDFSQGPIKPTGNSLDIALEGDAFLEVQTPLGIRLTRNGSFQINSEGFLVTKEGHPVLLEGEGGDIEARKIQAANQSVNITDDGYIFIDAQNQGRLSLVQVEPLQALRKGGGSLYNIKENMAPAITRGASVKIHQGYLEGSNVNIIQEMTNMIQTTRVFESTQKAIKAFDEMNGRLVNDIPTLK